MPQGLLIGDGRIDPTNLTVLECQREEPELLSPFRLSSGSGIFHGQNRQDGVSCESWNGGFQQSMIYRNQRLERSRSVKYRRPGLALFGVEAMEGSFNYQDDRVRHILRTISLNEFGGSQTLSGTH